MTSTINIPIHKESINDSFQLNPNKESSIIQINRDYIKILTYNLFLRPLVSTNGNDYKNERLKDFLDEISQFDVICLQEVFGFLNSRKTTLIYEAAKRGFFFFAEPPEIKLLSTNMIDGGILILSRFKIEKIEFFEYSYGISIDACVQKGLIYVKIRLNKGNLHIFNTHLQATDYIKCEKTITTSYLTRKTQIEELAYYINKCLEKNYSKENYLQGDRILLCGDINVDSSYGEMSWLYGNHSKEYNFFINELNLYKFKAIDLYYSHKGEHQKTFGGNDRTLYHPMEVDTYYSFDYMIEIFFSHFDDITKKEEKYVFDYSSISIEKFKLNKEKQKERVYTQLSDHYGLTINLKLNEV